MTDSTDKPEIVVMNVMDTSVPLKMEHSLRVSQDYVLPLIFNLELGLYHTYNTRFINITEIFIYTNYPEELEFVHSLQPLSPFDFSFPQDLNLVLDHNGNPLSFSNVPFVQDYVEEFHFEIKTVIGGARVFYKPILLTVSQ